MRCVTEGLLTFLKDVKKIGFLGYGKSNRAVLEYLSKRYDFEVVIREERSVTKDIPSSFLHLFGKTALDYAGEDVIFLSPSARRERPEIAALGKRGARFSSDAELFFALSDKPSLAVSGSDGKSTTVKMAEAMLNRCGINALACGNVGIPFVNALSQNTEIFITEISSFTLEYARPHTRRALITNITENHLDWHGSFDAYIAAKENLLRNTEEAILSPDTAACIPLILEHQPWGLFSTLSSYDELRKKYPCSQTYFTVEAGNLSVNGVGVLPVAALAKKEPHNVKNALAAIALTYGLFNTGAGILALGDFSGLSHRAETVAIKDGVRYIDSSIDSTPERTSVTLSSMPQRLIILLGGRGKGLSYEPLTAQLKSKSGDIIIFGENRDEIFTVLSRDAMLAKRIIPTDTLSEAVKIAKNRAKAGDTVLLSPASTSYDAFSNFEERGNKFKEYINQKD